MNSTLVQIHVFPAGIDLGRIRGYDPNKFGKVFSNTNEIKVNKVTTGYSVLYRDDMFNRLDTRLFAKNIVTLFMNNISSLVEMELCYYPMSRFTEETGLSIIHMNNLLCDMNVPRFAYYISDIISDLLKVWDKDEDRLILDGEEPDDVEDDWDDEEEDDDEDDDGDPFAFLRESLGDYDDDDEPKRKKSKKKSYGSSRVIKAAKNPKRDINRHGVVVCTDKSAVKKDERIIKDFLDDFIPGSADWRKQFRKKVLKRWISMYSITKKNLKHLEKEHRQNRKSKSLMGGIDKETAANFTRRLFTPSDSWNDPNR